MTSAVRWYVLWLTLLCGAVVAHGTENEEFYPIVRKIVLVQRDVFERDSADWFFAAGLANSLHTLTQDYLIDDEILLQEGEEALPMHILETERNLRRTGLFSSVLVRLDSVNSDTVDVVIFAQDRWSLRPALLIGTGGGISNLGAQLEEINLAGTGTQLLLSGYYRTENSIGWQGLAQVSQRRLFRSEISLLAALQATQYKTDQWLTLTKPYRTLSTPWAWSTSFLNSFGRDFNYIGNVQTTLLPFYEREFFGWISQASGEKDRLFVSGSARVSSVQRTVPTSRQAMDNTAQVLLAFSSIRQNFKRTQFLNGYEYEDIQEGAWGSAILGRVFSMGNGGQSMWYIGGMAEQSVLTGNTYLFGAISAGSGIDQGNARYTYLELQGIAHNRVSAHSVLCARIRSQTAWNWQAYRQLVLDLESGLRGFNANELSGENRIISNIEFRYFPQVTLWAAGLSGVAFYDVGTVWNQGTGLGKLQMKQSVGLGFRIHNLKAAGPDAIFRFDFAYNLTDNRFGGFVFTTNQLFSAFGTHTFKPPTILGTDIDTQ